MNVLFASMIWGVVGGAMMVFGKKQGSVLAMGGGAALVIISYFINSALWMSVVAVGIIALMWFLKDRI